VIDPENFDALLVHAIDGDIGEGREQKLAGSFLPSDAAAMGPRFQRLDASVKFAQGWPPVKWMAVSEVITNAL